MKLLIILPALNEARVIKPVLKQIKAAAAKLPLPAVICVVDDGSTDQTAAVCRQAGVAVLTHLINRGLGAALATGLEYARIKHFDFAITMDSDGQHDPEDLKNILKPLLKGQADVVIGSRLLQAGGSMPWLRRVNNRLFNALTKMLFRVTTTDSLSGFRGFNRQAINLIELKTDRMEVSNEFFSEIKHHQLKLAEVPIKVIYTDYSMAKGVKPGTAVAIVFKLLLRLLR